MTRRFTWAALSLAALLATASTLLADHRSAGEADVSGLALRLITSYYSGDAEGLSGIWNAGSETLSAFQRDAATVARVRCTDVRGIRLVDQSLDHEDLIVIVDAGIEHRKHPSSDESLVSIVRWRLVLDRKSGTPKVASAGAWGEHAARAFVQLPAVERHAYLQRHRDWIDPSFVRSLIVKGTEQEQAGDFDDAEELIRFAHEESTDLGWLAGQARAVSAQARILFRHGDSNRAVSEAKRAFALAELSDDPDAQVITAFNLGWIEEDLGHSDEALAITRKAMALKDATVETTSVSRLLANMVLSYLRRGDEVSAMACIREQERLTHLSGDPWGEARMNFGLANLRYIQDDFALAVRASRMATDFFAALKMDQIVVDGLAQQANILQDGGAYAEALEVLDRACKLARSTGDLAGERRCEAVRVLIAMKMTPAPGDAEIERLSQIALGQEELFGAFLELLAELRLRQHRFRDVIDIVARIQQRRAAGVMPGTDTAGAMSLEARARRPLGQIDEAIACLRRGATALESSRLSPAGSERQEWLAFRTAAKIYDQLAVLLIQKGDLLEALLTVERGRARTLLKLAASARGWLPADLTASERESVARIENRIAELNAELERATADRRPFLSERLDEARNELEELRARLFSDRRGDKRPAQFVAEISREILGTLPPDLTFIEYVAAFDDIYALTLRNAGGTPRVTAKRLGSKESIHAAAAELNARIARRDLDYRSSGRLMYDLLLAPFEDEFRSAATLCVIPTGELWSVPFAALVDEAGRYVATRHAVLYEPAVGVFLHLSRRPRGSNPKVLFAAGNPATEKGVSDTLAAAYHSVTLAPLPDAAREANTIARLYEGLSVAVTGSEATEEVVRKNVEGFDILHYAVHAILDDRNPMYSRLIFAKSSAVNDDGWLEAREVMDLSTTASIVVLSACDTARGKDEAGEGVIGLSWAFLAAGSRAIVATKWKAQSQSTARFMIDFHRRMEQGESPERALRKAQVSLMRDPRYLDPFYWAPFMLMGVP
jgi:CHAT domain-containing protein/tetratricopeptide (TPR) repeat protein